MFNKIISNFMIAFFLDFVRKTPLFINGGDIAQNKRFFYETTYKKNKQIIGSENILFVEGLDEKGGNDDVYEKMNGFSINRESKNYIYENNYKFNLLESLKIMAQTVSKSKINLPSLVPQTEEFTNLSSPDTTNSFSSPLCFDEKMMFHDSISILFMDW
jgi:hypothetical protein